MAKYFEASTTWSGEVQWCEARRRGKGSNATTYRVTLAATVYEFSQERNHEDGHSEEDNTTSVCEGHGI